MISFDWTRAIVAVYGDSGPVGTGFVVSAGGLILTCGHVLSQAGWPYQEWSEPVQVRFKATRRFAQARVLEDCYSDESRGDYALLALTEPLAEDVAWLPLWPAAAAGDHSVAMFGYLADFRDGLHGRGKVLGLVKRHGRQALQLASQETTHGYSGGPVWDPTWGRVIGMVQKGMTADAIGRHPYTAFAIPAEVLVEACSDRLALSRPESLISQATGHIRGAVEDLLAEYAAMVFVGRDESLDDLDDWLSGAESGRLALTALAGYGKTALLANWLRRRQEQGDRVAYHFFSQRLDVLRPVANLYANLLGQLADFSGQYQLTLPEEDARPALLRSLVQEYEPEAGRRLIFLIDALDEAQDAFQLSLPAQLPPGVYLLVSARAGPPGSDEDLPPYLDGWVAGAARRHLTRLPKVALAGWLAQAGDGLLRAESQDRDFRRKLYDVSDGYPLYLRYLLDDLVQAKQAGQRPETLLDRPARGFGDYVAHQVRRLAADLGRQRSTQEFFVLLAVARYPLLEDEVTELAGLTLFDLAALPTGLTRWLIIGQVQDGRRTYVLAHARLAGEFENALRGMAQGKLSQLLTWCANWPDHRSPYALRHYPELLARDGQWTRLFELAFDADYVAAQQAALPAEPDLPLRTVRLALDEAGRQRRLATMARLLLEHARRVRQMRQHSPLQALRSMPGLQGLGRAWQLAEAHEHQRRVMWYLLLAAELADPDQDGQPEATLERLAREPIPALSEAWQEAATWLLLDLLASQPAATMPILKTAANDDQKGAIARTLIGGGQRSLARQVATSMGQPAGRVGALLAVAEAHFEAGEVQAGQALLDQAFKSFRVIGDPWARRNLIGKLVAAQTRAGDEGAILAGLAALRRALEQLADLGEMTLEEMTEFRRLIAQEQIELGDFEAAQETAGFMSDDILIEIAANQANRGQQEAALATIGRLLGSGSLEGDPAVKARLVQRLAPDYVWGEEGQGSLALARAVDDPWCRAEWLSVLAGRWWYGDQPDVARELCAEAYAAGKAIADPVQRVAMLCRIAETALAMQARPLAIRIIAAAREAVAQVDEAERSPLLGQVATTQLRLGQFEQALATTSLMDAGQSKVETLREFLYAMTGFGPEPTSKPIINQIVAEIGRLPDSEPRDYLLSRVASLLSQSDDFDQAWQAAAKIGDERLRSDIFDELLWSAPPTDLGPAVRLAQEFEDEALRQELLDDVAYQMVEAGQPDQAEEVLEYLADGQSKEQLRAVVIEAWLAAGDGRKALALAEDAPTTRDRVWALIHLALHQHQAGNGDRAAAACEMAQGLVDELDEGRPQAEALADIAAAQMRIGQEPAGLASVQRALSLADQIPQPRARAAALGVIALRLAEAGASEHAVRALDRAVEATEALASAEAAMEILADLVVALAKIPAPQMVRRLADRAVQAGEGLADGLPKARAFVRLAYFLAGAGEYATTWSALKEALTIYLDGRSEVEEEWRRDVDEIMGSLLDDYLGRRDPAGPIELAQALDRRPVKSWVWKRILDRYLSSGYAGVALDQLDEAVLDDLDENTIIKLAEAQNERGRYEAARSMAGRIGSDWLRSVTLGKIALAQANGGDARGGLQTALAINDRYEFESRIEDILAGQYADQGAAAVLETAAEFEEPLILDIGRDIVARGQIADGDLDAATEATTLIADPWWRDGLHKELADARRRAGHLPEALAAARRIGDARQRAESLAAIALDQGQAGQDEAAERSFALYLSAAAAIEDRQERTGLLLKAAGEWRAAGRAAAARDAVALALEPVARLDDSLPRALALTEIARAQAQSGADPAAAETLRDAAALVTASENVADRDRVLLAVVLAQVEMGQLPAAEQTAAGIEDQLTLIRSLTEIAAGRAENGRYADALETVRLISSYGHRDRARQRIAQLQAEAGNFAAALETVNLIEGKWHKDQALKELAHLQAGAGDRAGAQATIAFIESDRDKELARQELEESPAAAGGSALENAPAGDAEVGDDPDPERLAAWLLVQAKAQARAGQDQNVEALLAAARSVVGQIGESRSQAEALRAIVVAAGRLGYGDEVLAGYRQLLAAAGQLDDDRRRRTQGDVALALARVGQGGRAVDVAEQIPDSQARFLPELALLLARAGDAQSLSRLWPLCAYDPGIALRSCAAIAYLDPDQAAAVADVVLNHSWT